MDATAPTQESSLEQDWEAVALEAGRNPTPPKLKLPDLPDREPRLRRKWGEWALSGKLTCFTVLAAASVLAQLPTEGLAYVQGYDTIPLTLGLLYTALLTPLMWALLWPMIGSRRWGAGALLLIFGGAWGATAGYLATATTEAGMEFFTRTHSYRPGFLETLLVETVRLEQAWQQYATWPQFALMLALAALATLWALRVEKAAPWLDPSPAGPGSRVAAWSLLVLAPLLLYGALAYLALPSSEVREWLREMRQLEESFPGAPEATGGTPLTIQDRNRLWELRTEDSNDSIAQLEAELLRLSTGEFEYTQEFGSNLMIGHLWYVIDSPKATRRAETLARLLEVGPAQGVPIGHHTRLLLVSVCLDPLADLDRLSYPQKLRELREELVPTLEAADRTAYREYLRFHRHLDTGQFLEEFVLYSHRLDPPLSTLTRRALILPQLEAYVRNRVELSEISDPLRIGSIEMVEDLEINRGPILYAVLDGPINGRLALEYAEVLLQARLYHRSHGSWPLEVHDLRPQLSFDPPNGRFPFELEGEHLVVLDTVLKDADNLKQGVRLTP